MSAPEALTPSATSPGFRNDFQQDRGKPDIQG